MTSGLGITLTLLAWWVGTGAVFVAARGGAVRRRWSFGLATAMGAVALAALPTLAGRTDLGGILLALLAGFTLWAWVELSFYTGYVTGPSRALPPAGATLGVRFRHALAACLWHELTIPALGMVIWALAGSGEHLWSLWIYLTFWVLHEVARINVLVGVPHPFAELLPDHLDHLKPYLEPRRPGWLLPATLAAHVLALTVLVSASMGAVGTPALLGWAAVSALVALGWIEHLVLLLPIPLERLWRSLGMGKPQTAPEAVPLA
ncbi:MAG: putative photosynthetic complex assembly protein PuhE [Gemmatimonadota bacterium]